MCPTSAEGSPKRFAPLFRAVCVFRAAPLPFGLPSISSKTKRFGARVHVSIVSSARDTPPQNVWHTLYTVYTLYYSRNPLQSHARGRSGEHEVALFLQQLAEIVDGHERGRVLIAKRLAPNLQHLA